MEDMENKGKAIKLSLDVACVFLVLLVLWFAFTLGIERGRYAILFLGISFVISALKVLMGNSFLALRGKSLLAAKGAGQ